jgi:hypothetical protein
MPACICDGFEGLSCEVAGKDCAMIDEVYAHLVDDPDRCYTCGSRDIVFDKVEGWICRECHSV